jgi:uncharacterized membrane protein/protein-disulfide isomerase
MRWGLIRGLSLAALGLSGFLLWGSWGTSPLPGCGPDSGCGSVLGSRWAYVLGIPVSLPAVIAYLVLLAGTIVYPRADTPNFQRRIGWALLAVAGAVVGAAVWFSGLQIFVTKAICPFCMAVHGCGFVVGILIFSQGLPGGQRRTSTPVVAHPSLCFSKAAMWPVLSGVAGVGLLASIQVLHEPSARIVGVVGSEDPRPALPQPGQAATDRDPSRPVSGQNASAGRRMLPVYGGEFQLDLEAYPILGSPDAPSVMVCLFDYTCDHCRELHRLLAEAVHNLSNRLAVAFLPVPLDPECNPSVKVSRPEHRAACDYARTGLAVWRADRAQGHAFDEWIFAQRELPSPEEARAEALRLVGTNAFTKALQDPGIAQQLEWAMRLHHTNYLRYRHSALPQLTLGTNLVFGGLRTREQLHRLLSAGGVFAQSH